MKEEIYNSEDHEQIKKAQKKADKKKFEQDEVIRNIMSTKAGRSWIHHILTLGDMWGSPIVLGDPYATYNNIGMANLARLLWIEIEEVVPESYALMVKEGRDDEKREHSDAP